MAATAPQQYTVVDTTRLDGTRYVAMLRARRGEAACYTLAGAVGQLAALGRLALRQGRAVVVVDHPYRAVAAFTIAARG